MNNEQEMPKPGIGIFYGFMFVVGTGLLLLVPIATTPGPAEQGWWTQPAFMPLLSLLLIALAATYLCFQHFRSTRSAAESADDSSLADELIQWIKPFEFFVYYIVYIWLLGLIGYFLSSLLFILVLSWRIGLRSPRWMLTGFLFSIVLIAMFRWALGIWVPQAELYALFPKDIRIFLMNNF
ncbi:MAG: tripartite tricarboxylate transporter TctB family protein [Chloroflexota bacterium]